MIEKTEKCSHFNLWSNKVFKYVNLWTDLGTTYASGLGLDEGSHQLSVSITLHQQSLEANYWIHSGAYRVDKSNFQKLPQVIPEKGYRACLGETLRLIH